MHSDYSSELKEFLLTYGLSPLEIPAPSSARAEWLLGRRLDPFPRRTGPEFNGILIVIILHSILVFLLIFRYQDAKQIYNKEQDVFLDWHCVSSVNRLRKKIFFFADTRGLYIQTD